MFRQDFSVGTEKPAIDERVAAGAAFLEARHPNWDTRVDVGTLDIRKERYCILGQLYESFYETARIVLQLTDDEAARMGFTKYKSIAEFDELTEAWKRLIMARRAL